MTRGGKLERKLPVTLTSKASANRSHTRSLRSVQRLRARDLQQSNRQLCCPPYPLSEPETLEVDVANKDNSLPGSGVKWVNPVVEMSSTLSPSACFEELVVPDSPEEVWASKEPVRLLRGLRRASFRNAVRNLGGELEVVDGIRYTSIGAPKKSRKRSLDDTSFSPILDHPEANSLPSCVQVHQTKNLTCSLESAKADPGINATSRNVSGQCKDRTPEERGITDVKTSADGGNLLEVSHEKIYSFNLGTSIIEDHQCRASNQEPIRQGIVPLCKNSTLEVPSLIPSITGHNVSRQALDKNDSLVWEDPVGAYLDIWLGRSVRTGSLTEEIQAGKFRRGEPAVPKSRITTGAGRMEPVSLSSTPSRKAEEDMEECADLIIIEDQTDLSNENRTNTFSNAKDKVPVSTIFAATVPFTAGKLCSSVLEDKQTEQCAGFPRGEDQRIVSSESRPAHLEYPDCALPLSAISTISAKAVPCSGWKQAISVFGNEECAEFPRRDNQWNLPRESRPVNLSSTGRALPVPTCSAPSRQFVGVSSVAWKKAKALLRDERTEGIAEFKRVEDPRNGASYSELLVPTFSTASGKIVSVSSAALKKAKLLLEDEQTEKGAQFSRGEDQGNVPCGSPALRVSTSFLASEKPSSLIPVPAGIPRSLHAGKINETYSGISRVYKRQGIHQSGSVLETFDPCSLSYSGGSSGVKRCSEGGMKVIMNLSPPSDRRHTTGILEQGLTSRTGTGRSVAILSDPVEKSNILLADGERNATSIQSTSTNSKWSSLTRDRPNGDPTFRTGSGRAVPISKEAIERAKRLLVDDDSEPSRGELALSSRKMEPREPESASQSWNECHGSTQSRVLPVTVTVWPEQLQEDLKFGANEVRDSTCGPFIAVPSQSRPHNSYNQYKVTELGKLSSTAGLKGIRPFKPPRHLRKVLDVSWTSSGNQGTECASTSRVNFSNQQSSFSWTSTPPGRKLLPLSNLPIIQYGDNVGGSGLMKLRKCFSGHPTKVLSLPSEVRLMTADTAENYRFQIVTEDGEEQSLGFLEVWKLFLSLGADPRYASEEWVANHFKWIVWKLSSFERKYARQAAQMLLTLDTLLCELKIRYDKELSGHRSAIRRITEKDSSAAQMMVLCISAVRCYSDCTSLDEKNGNANTLHGGGRKVVGNQQEHCQTAKVEVTDGWYRLHALLDAPLTKQLKKGKLKVGHKIRVCGATLTGCPDGTPPLEAFGESLLMLHMNGTYRACWDQRLGFCRGTFIPLALKCIKPDGGVVPQTYVGVSRVYPMLFREKCPKGVSVVRSGRAEKLVSTQFEHRCSRVLEETILKLEASYNPSTSSYEEMDEETKLFVTLESANEPELLLADMSTSQHKAFSAFQTKRDASKQAAYENAMKEALEKAELTSRHVQPLMKVRVTGLKCKGKNNEHEGHLTDLKEGIITIWEPSEEQCIEEGSVYCVSGLQPSTWSTSCKNDLLQLQSFRSTIWRLVPPAVHDKNFLFPYNYRMPTRLSDLDEKFLGREFDVAAIVLHVGEPFSSGPRKNQWVFMTDGSTAKSSSMDTWEETQLLVVRVNISSEAFVPVEDSIVGAVIGYCNLLQQPKDHNSRLWVAEASELAIYSSNLSSPPLRHLKTAAYCVSKWAANTPWMVEDMRNLVQTLMCS